MNHTEIPLCPSLQSRIVEASTGAVSMKRKASPLRILTQSLGTISDCFARCVFDLLTIYKDWEMRIRFLVISIIISAILSAYVLAYVSLREIYIIDNVFVSVVYAEKSASVYSLIELYYGADPHNRVTRPTDMRTNIRDLPEMTVLNVRRGSRDIMPGSGWFIPSLFCPIEKFEIRYLTEKGA